MQKQFLLTWGDGYSISDTLTVNMKFICDGNGYTQDDIDGINDLNIGETYRTENDEEHFVKRIA